MLTEKIYTEWAIDTPRTRQDIQNEFGGNPPNHYRLCLTCFVLEFVAMLKSQRPRRSRRLAVEGLERREMLATVVSAGGMLIITGDATSENITVTQTPTGLFQITGAGPTRTVPAAFGIYADLGAGNDTLTLGTPDRPLPLLSSVVIRLGDGSDTANLSINIPGSVIIDGGIQFNSAPQNDVINIDRSLIGSLTVNTYAGDDTLAISRSGILSLFANLGMETLTAGQRDYDTATFQASAMGMATISLGEAGADPTLWNRVLAQSTIFGSLSITGGAGIDQIEINSVGEGIGTWLPSHIVNTAETLEPLLKNIVTRSQIAPLLGNLDGMLDSLPSLPNVTLPNGAAIDSLMTLIGSIDLNRFDLSDTLAGLLRGIDLSFIGDTSIVGVANILTQTGDDLIEVNDVVFLTNALLHTGIGHDVVNLTSVDVIGNLSVLLGGGADTLRLIDVAAAVALLDGGTGNDSILNVGNTGLGKRSRSIINFEFPILVGPVLS